MKKLNKYIDHTNLKPFATVADIEKLCCEAKENGFASVCVNPCNVLLAKKLLEGSDVEVCTVIGFPLGQNTTEIKVAETKKALEDGCEEFDMVINIGALKDGKTDFVRDEIAAVDGDVDDGTDNEIGGGIEVCSFDNRGMGRSSVPTKKSAYT